MKWSSIQNEWKTGIQDEVYENSQLYLCPGKFADYRWCGEIENTISFLWYQLP